MDSTIIAALISAATAVLVTTIPHAIMVRRDEHKLDRFRGVWTGRGNQNATRNDVAPEYDVRLQVDTRTKIALILHRQDGEFDFANHLTCNALTVDTEFMLIHYRNVREEKRQFGSVILRISSDGLALSGVLVGYGVRSERAVTATLDLKRA